MDWLIQPWPWYVAGPLIALIMITLLWFGKSFGVSSTMRSLCTIGGAGNVAEFFKFDWKGQRWNLIFIAGAFIGGFLVNQFFPDPNPVAVSEATVQELNNLGIAHEPGLIPTSLFNWSNLLTVPGFIVMIVGGFLVGFGARYAGGCTSGHAISGLSNLQTPSLLAVVGFFIGGLFTTHVILPWLFK